MKPPSLHESLKRLVPQLPRIVPANAGAPLHFASSGGGGNYDDPDEYYDDVPDDQPQPARRDRREEATAARRRTVQSEPDDRYWTDYLRIALPVIGLLLVIAVFWYWAQQLIDDDNGGELDATEPAGIAEVVETATSEPTEPAATGTPAESASETQQGGEEAVPPTSVQSGSQQEQAVPTPTPSPVPEEATNSGVSGDELTNALQQTTGGGSGEIQADMTVVVTQEGDQLSLRSDSTTAENNVITNLAAGTELDVVAGPVEAEGYTWWQVVTPTGDTGWVVEGNDESTFIEPAA